MPRFEPLPKRRPALVAGASSGIGAAAAIDLAAHGFPVALGARRVEKCEEIVAQIKADGGEAIAVHLDVTDPDSVKTCVERTVDELGEIEVLVAGAGDRHRVEEVAGRQPGHESHRQVTRCATVRRTALRHGVVRSPTGTMSAGSSTSQARSGRSSTRADIPSRWASARCRAKDPGP